MAKLIIKLEKEDIKTNKIGDNIMVQCENDIDLIFTPEATKEFIDDYTKMSNISDGKYTFNPLEHGFEPIANYPELKGSFPIIDGYYIKVVCHSKDNGNLVYWYLMISTLIGAGRDDRIKISSGSFNFDILSDNRTSKTDYFGLITNDIFAEQLLKHLLGTTLNKSLNGCAIERYNENVGPEMRSNFPKYYQK